MIRIAINGFGRIGRNVLRAALKNKSKLEFVAINDLTDSGTLAHLLKYDSIHGIIEEEISSDENSIFVGSNKINVFSERDPEKLPWKKLGVDVVLESTGVFRTKDSAGKHLRAGAKKVALSAPPKDDGIPQIVPGVNDKSYAGEEIVSMASCTTNSLAPMAFVLQNAFGIEQGFISTIHAYTNDQKILDLPHSDLRRARAAAVNIIPTTTGAAKAVTKVMPELEGRLDGIAVRVPVPDGSLTDFVGVLEKETSIEEINSEFKKAGNGKLKGILEYSEEELVSSDIVGNAHSCVFDSKQTMCAGKMFKVLGWYDNEWGYSSRMAEFLDFIAK